MPDNVELLHKRITASGLWSRRKAQELIVQGRVTVDGETIIDKAARVFFGGDVKVDGRRLQEARVRYLILNKPAGYVTTLSDPHASRTVADLIAGTGALVKPVGRLDKDTEGLLLLTNDGELAFRLTHPSYGVDKEYEVEVSGEVSPAAISKLERGVVIEGKRTSEASIPAESVHTKEGRSRFRIVMHEGRKRQIRLMCLAVGHPVKKLRRVRVGPVSLHGLAKGTCRELSKTEVSLLRRAVGLDEAGGLKGGPSPNARPASPSRKRNRQAPAEA